MKDHLAPYYADPLHQMIGMLELDIELTPSPVPVGMFEPLLPDPIAEQLEMLEDGIEGMTIPGPPPPPDLPVATLPPSLALGGPRSPDSPVPEEALGRDWPGLMAPPAARPFFTHEGLDDRGYHPQLGGSTGIRADSALPACWYHERGAVTGEMCASCPVEKYCHESGQEDEKSEPEESEREN